ncbi:FxsA family protein [Vibrio navarrensis]|uniref:FxsA family protein n=1 Tax=Vibrio navarrensis TaxID=29495 RepID=UPI001869C2F3|nr:FxsA family protein [Vibrio navarrensis]MBE4608516.1 membrane protein FxsA [Vibrio navarrensis]MBE4611984.1 membrane protein FxsA [Vibrio navarrensis]
MFPVLLLLFICVPIIEIGLFIQVGGFLGLWPTIGLVLLTAFVGASLVRSQGLQTLLSVQQRLQQGELPAQHIVEGVMLAVAGVLLLTPGFMTDAMGMVVLLPAPRAALARVLMSKVVVKSSFTSHSFEQETFSHRHHDAERSGQTFEGEFERKDDDEHKPKLK